MTNMSAFDAIIVLSHHMDSSGRLNSESCLRADKAAEIFRSSKKSKIITCGWSYRKDCNIKIADSMSNYLHQKHNVPEENLIRDYKSRDTVGDAVFTRKDILPTYNLKNLAIVTSFYHGERTEEIFRFVYGNEFKLSFFFCDIPLDELNRKSEMDSLISFRETFFGVKAGDIDNIYLRLVQNHPYYNGEIFNFNDNNYY